MYPYQELKGIQAIAIEKNDRNQEVTGYSVVFIMHLKLKAGEIDLTFYAHIKAYENISATVYR